MKQLFTLFSLFMVLAVTAQPVRTAVLTGNVGTDFKPVEKNGIYAMTWDANFLYLGVTGGGTFIKDEPTLVYLSKLGTSGNDSGFNYDNRRGPLPFKGNAVVFFKNGYGEVRRDSAAGFEGWSNNKAVTDSIKTGTNDIEVKISWVDLFGTAGVPSNLGVFFFKENGNGSQSDAYFVRPGVKFEDNDDYSNDVKTKPIELFYRFRTDSKFYSNLNMFQWITNEAGNLCAAPPTKVETNKTTTSVRLNWDTVAGPRPKQYQIRRRKTGTTSYTNTLVSGNRTYLAVTGLTCGTSYDWFIRALCDTAGVDIASGFSAKRTFTTSTCFGPRGINNELIDENGSVENVVVYPVPARKGSRINVGSQEFRNNAGFSIINIAGKQVQQGIVNNGALNLSNSVPTGTYILELRNTNSVVRKKIIVLQ